MYQRFIMIRMKTLSERIKYAMATKGVKQSDLAKLAGVSSPAVNKWVKGNTKNLKGENLVAIASALGVSVAWLADGHNEKTLPFKKINLDDLLQLPPDYLEEIEEFICFKLEKFRQADQANKSKKSA